MFDDRAEADDVRPASTGPTGIPVDPRRIVAVIAAKRRLLLALLLLGALLGAALAKTVVPRRYDAFAVLAWERTVTANAVDVGADRELKTLAESVKLPENLSTVRERLGLGTTLERLGRSVEVKTGRDSNLLTIAAASDDPAAAAALAQAVVDVFLDHRVEVERKRSEEEVARLEANARAAQDELDRERRAFDAFRSEHGILDLSIERQAALDHAGRLRAEADLARAEAEGQRARMRIFVDAARDQSPIALLAEKEFHPDQTRLAEARAELAALEGRLAPDHPKVASLTAEVEALAKRAGSKEFVARSERTVGRNPQWEAIQLELAEAKAGELQAGTRESSYEELAKRADDQVLRLTRVEGEVARLHNRVKVAERHLTELQALASAAKDVARAPAPGFRVLTSPRPPDLPTSSSRKLVALGTPVIAVLLGLVWVVVRELARGRIVSSRELAFWTGVPVVAVSPWPKADEAALETTAFDLVDVLGEDPDVVWLPADEASLAATRALAAEVHASSFALGEPCIVDDPRLPRNRRLVRHAAQAVIVATAGRSSAFALRERFAGLGHPAVAAVLLGADAEVGPMPDRVGDVSAFSAHAIPAPEGA
jgi:uncharacterized protein involved in exopolysaccharide biosynthesis